MELLTKLGIDWRLLIAQLVNFLVLLAVLYRFLYGPIIKMLTERSEKIARSLAEASKIEEESARAAKTREELILKAREEAQKIMKDVQERAEAARAEAAEKARAETERIVASGKALLQSEKSAMLAEAHKELSELVITATERVLQETITEGREQKFIKETVRAMAEAKK